jgi:cellulose synthase/poly-beta-1,6-N-acetylglucosamine synthase-like glycosyltransferase
LLEIGQILQFFVLLSFGIPFFIFGVYGTILLYYNRRSNRQDSESVYNRKVEPKPIVSVVIPTHNEETIISKKIENLLASDYPMDRLEGVFVDDSDDSTASIIEEYSKKFSNVHLIKFRERMGYSPCMIAGCNLAKGEIMVLSDAGAFLDPQAIPNLVRHFRNPEVGAVTGRDVILNVNEETGRAEDLYQRIYNFVRTSETKMDSTFYFKGEASAVRKDLISDLEKCSATFDTAAALWVRQKRYKTIYDPQVKFYEYAPNTNSERIRQKTTRGANLIKILFQFKSMIFRAKYGKFGLIILPMNLAMLVVAPIAILAGIVSLAALSFFDFAFASIIWSILGVLFLFSLLFSKRLVFTFLEFNLSLLRALYEIIFIKRRHDMIEKIASTRR